ncbi:hypothetical protein [Dyella sp.]|uniref:hypothetical protein n=1 Tax=Dyella sp. TaxID=1869338 RepID=UPI002ED358D2
MKKKYYALLAATLGAVTFGSAFAAAPTASIKLSGTLSPPNCTVVMADDGEFGIGKISPTLIKPDKVAVLDPVEKELVVTCDASTYLTFSVIDNEKSSSALSHKSAFGEGFVNGSGKLGYYQVLMSDAKVSLSSGSPEIPARAFMATAGAITPGDRIYLSGDAGDVTGWADASKNEMIAAQLFKAKFTLTPTLASAKDMKGAITDDAAIAGSLTLNFKFGL